MNVWSVACGTQDFSTNTTQVFGICAEKRGLRTHSVCHNNWPPYPGHPECFGWNRKSGSIEKQEKKVAKKKIRDKQGGTRFWGCKAQSYLHDANAKSCEAGLDHG